MSEYPALRSAVDLTEALLGLPQGDKAARQAAAERQDQLTKPRGALGRLEDLAIWLAGWQGRERPQLDRAACLVFAANHGVVAQGVSAFPAEVTAQMVLNFEAGGAAINQLCDVAGANLSVIDVGVAHPTADFTLEPAMSEADCAAALAAGAAAVPADADIVLVGEMGIGNTTTAAALAQAVFGGAPEDWVGPGTGLDASGIALKARVVKTAMERHDGRLDTAFDCLCAVGGRELAAIAGAVLSARYCRIPVILDGFVATAAAATLTRDNPDALDHAILSHQSAEPGHRHLADKLGLEPLVDFGMRLGEASGAAVALLILRAALAAHNGMATFAEAGVSDRE